MNDRDTHCCGLTHLRELRLQLPRLLHHHHLSGVGALAGHLCHRCHLRLLLGHQGLGDHLGLEQRLQGWLQDRDRELDIFSTTDLVPCIVLDENIERVFDSDKLAVERLSQCLHHMDTVTGNVVQDPANFFGKLSKRHLELAHLLDL